MPMSVISPSPTEVPMFVDTLEAAAEVVAEVVAVPFLDFLDTFLGFTTTG